MATGGHPSPKPTIPSQEMSSPTGSDQEAPTLPVLVDVKNVKLQEVFQTSPGLSDDEKKPYIWSMVCLSDGRLVLGDVYNKRVKVLQATRPYAVTASLRVNEEPRCLAVLSDGQVAMTTHSRDIYLMMVTDTVTKSKVITTEKHYDGIAGLNKDQLIVSHCGVSDAVVDILDMNGQVVRTVKEGLKNLCLPMYLCLTEDEKDVLVSDFQSQQVFQISIHSGETTILTPKDRDKNISGLCQVCVNNAGQKFVASSARNCVVAMDKLGVWVPVLSRINEQYNQPRGLCITKSGLLVVAWLHTENNPSKDDSFVIGYKLQ